MAAFSDDFLRFLEANYPDDYRRASVKDVKEDVITSIMSKHAGHYAIWLQIPEHIKNEYIDRLPREVLNGNKNVQAFIEEETHKENEKQKETSEIIDFSVTLLALGYSTETISTLSQNQALRQDLLKQADGLHLSKELLAQWLATRQADITAIKDEWKTRQPEKYLMHLVKSINREELRRKKSENSEQSLASETKIREMKEEFLALAKNLDTREARLNMVNFLCARPQQAALHHLTPDTLDFFTSSMQRQGIVIERNTQNMERSPLTYDTLPENLKKDYARMEKHENIFRNMIKKDKQHLQRASARIIQKNHEAVAKVITMRSHSKKVASA